MTKMDAVQKILISEFLLHSCIELVLEISDIQMGQNSCLDVLQFLENEISNHMMAGAHYVNEFINF